MRRLVPVAAILVLTLAGCRSGAAPSAAPAETAPAETAPAETAPAGTAPTGAPPASAAPAATTRPAPLIALADPRAGRAAGAELGEAAPLPAVRLLELPAPHGPGALPRGTRPPLIFHGPRDDKRVALTFDSNMTDAMLRRLAGRQVRSYANYSVVDELQRTHTPATFFLAGKWVEAYPQLTRRLAADPDFELASHSWAHEGFHAPCYGLGTIARADMAADVERSFQVLARYTDRPTRYFRFPGGCYDQAALDAIAPTGCTAVEYDDVSGDAFGHNPKRIADDTVAQARPGSIVVLHITEANAPATAKALPQIITRLRAGGYQLVTLSALLGR
ncbi:polysaccharide deacetylase family protein [Paractinoplanes globisporus]|uniref:Polysaccharide deacetylase family protein n=1 Tax=Paractinoplanes globisporus TaxID=113565 RepID=A0ABW6W7B6_9ACTN|nr:polysaccharide deacetylase family protein [Actinoplanes globisporus]